MGLDSKVKVIKYPYLDKFIYARRYTTDLQIFDQVVNQNKYKVPNSIDSNVVIVDIGSHIGSFSFLCLCNGSKFVYSYESDFQTYKICKFNLEKMGGNVENTHVWRSDNLFKDFNQIMIKSLDEIIDEVSLDGKRKIDVLKISIEGFEYPVLLSSKKLEMVNFLCGKYFEIEENYLDNIKVNGYNFPYNKFTLKQCLDSNGFRKTTIIPTSKNSGLFFAEK